MKRSYIHIGILKYPKVQLAAVHGLTDMLMIANDLIEKKCSNDTPLFNVSHWELDKEKQQIVSCFSSDEKNNPQQNVIVVLGAVNIEALSHLSEVYTKWISAQHAGGAIASSVCIGAFLLAQSGILANRCVTTHWAFEQQFTIEHPDVELASDKVIVDSGDVITSSSMLAWLDIGMKFIHQFAGAEILADVSKYFLNDSSGQAQKFYLPYTPPFAHGDKTVIRVQHWIQAELSQSLSLTRLADIASVSVRTLIRRFHKAINMSPTTYIQRVRIEKARELLVFTSSTVNQIAWQVGYKDPGSFRKVFQRELGMTPVEYRQRFKV